MFANESILGVDISDPKQEMSEKPKSSAKIIIMFGLLLIFIILSVEISSFVNGMCWE